MPADFDGHPVPFVGHGGADVDTSTLALHHTLGGGANQAAPGNHSHVPSSTTVATSQATASLTYADLTTTGPAQAVTIGSSGKALVILTADITAPANGLAYMAFAVSGATTVAASDTQSLMCESASVANRQQASAIYLVTGLTAGLNTFTAKYRSSSGGSCTFANRSIIVLPL